MSSSAQGLKMAFENMSSQSRPLSKGDDNGVVAAEDGLLLRVSESVVVPENCVLDQVEDDDARALNASSVRQAWRSSTGRMLGRLYCDS